MAKSVGLRVSDEERATLEKLASDAGVSITEYVKRRLLSGEEPAAPAPEVAVVPEAEGADDLAHVSPRMPLDKFKQLIAAAGGDDLATARLWSKWTGGSVGECLDRIGQTATANG